MRRLIRNPPQRTRWKGQEMEYVLTAQTRQRAGEKEPMPGDARTARGCFTTRARTGSTEAAERRGLPEPDAASRGRARPRTHRREGTRRPPHPGSAVTARGVSRNPRSAAASLRHASGTLSAGHRRSKPTQRRTSRVPTLPGWWLNMRHGCRHRPTRRLKQEGQGHARMNSGRP